MRQGTRLESKELLATGRANRTLICQGERLSSSSAASSSECAVRVLTLISSATLVRVRVEPTGKLSHTSALLTARVA